MRRPFRLGQTFVTDFEQVEVIPCARSSKLRDRDKLINTLQVRKGWRRSNIVSEPRKIDQQTE